MFFTREVSVMFRFLSALFILLAISFSAPAEIVREPPYPPDYRTWDSEQTQCFAGTSVISAHIYATMKETGDPDVRNISIVKEFFLGEPRPFAIIIHHISVNTGNGTQKVARVRHVFVRQEGRWSAYDTARESPARFMDEMRAFARKHDIAKPEEIARCMFRDL